MVHALTNLAMDAAMSQDPDADLLGPFTADNVDAELLRVCKTIYLQAPLFGLFLERYHTPMKAWTRLYVAIVDGG